MEVCVGKAHDDVHQQIPLGPTTQHTQLMVAVVLRPRITISQNPQLTESRSPKIQIYQNPNLTESQSLRIKIFLDPNPQ